MHSTPAFRAASKYFLPYQTRWLQTALRLFSLGVPMNVINQNLDLGLPDLPHGRTCYLPANVQAVDPALAKSLSDFRPADRAMREP